MTTKCTACGATPAYIPFFGDCECSSSSCKFFSKTLFPDLTAKVAEQPKEIDSDEDQKPQYLWSNRHNDFGDI